MEDDEDLLLTLLNSTPLMDGHPVDQLADPADAVRRLRALGAAVDVGEHAPLLRARDLLQAVVRGTAAPQVLAPLLEGTGWKPEVGERGVERVLHTPAGHLTAVRAVLAWDLLRRERPGRLRPCANDECRLFLVDHSRPGTGRWCSMATCGNRMKARRHQSRAGS